MWISYAVFCLNDTATTEIYTQRQTLFPYTTLFRSGSFAPSMFLPLGHLTSGKLQVVVDFMYPLFKDNDWKLIISHTDEDKLDLARGLTGYNLEFKYDRDYSDYIYQTKSFIEMKGPEYHSIKNSIKSFKKHNPACIYETMSEASIDECDDLLKRWEIQKGTEADCPQIRLLLNDFSKIGLKGGTVRVNGKIESFIIGEKAHDMGYIHAGKANIDINGLYAYTMREFVNNEFSDTTNFNRSDDLGIPNLRHAKLLYNPSKILHKYNIHFLKI